MVNKILNLNEDNAEEVLNEVVEYIKNKAATEIRTKTIKDCTEYWKTEVLKILKDGSPNGAKVSQIRQLFGIEPIDE